MTTANITIAQLKKIKATLDDNAKKVQAIINQSQYGVFSPEASVATLTAIAAEIAAEFV